MNETVEKAVEYFSNKHFCSQAILCAFCEKYGLDKETAFKISSGLNSGLRNAEVCGAVSGAVLVIGLKYGASKGICNAKTEEFMNHFRDKHKSVVCRDLLGCDISTPDGRNMAIKDNLFRTRCPDLVRSAAQSLIDLGY